MTTTTIDRPAAREALANLLAHYSVEITTRDRASLDAAKRLLPRGTEVFIVSLPKDTMDHPLATAVELASAGLTPVPHIVARNISDIAALDALLSRLAAEAGVKRALVLGGDRDRPAGELESSLQLIETGLFQKHGVNRISIACYPEGHPRIPDAALDAARTAKLAAAESAGLDVGLVSQFCFDANPIIALAERLRAGGVKAPLRVGAAGPAERASLLKYALICGVGQSLRVLKERHDLARSALAGETPEAVLTGAALARTANPALGMSGVHFFTFGSLASTVKWVESFS
jgi:methylenetetrahydrofolate reductase (NADPH)